MSWVLAWNLDC